MDRQSGIGNTYPRASTPYGNATTTSTNTTTTTTTTTNTASHQRGNAKADKYAQLLENFPGTLHEELTDAFPDRTQLKAFHKSLMKSDTPVTESSISDALMAVSKRRSDFLKSMQGDIKSLLDEGRSVEKIKSEYLAAVIQCALPIDRRWIQAAAEKMVDRMVSGFELEILLCDATTSIDKVIAHLHKEGHPEGITEFSDYVHTLDVYSSGAKRILSLLQESKASDRQKIFWMASILAHTNIALDFPAMRGLEVRQWAELVMPLIKPMNDDTIILSALNQAAVIAIENGKPQKLADYLRNDAVSFLKSYMGL